MNDKKSGRPELFVDNERYDWDKDMITGAEIRTLASVPDDADIFQHIPGEKDRPIADDTVVDLAEHPGPERFSTQSSGSQAG